MSTCGFLKYISLLILVNVGQIPRTGSAPVLATNRRVPVEGVSFSITCTLDAAITSTVRFYKGASVQGGCTSSGSCSSPVSGYSVSLDSTSRILTLDIASPESTRDSGTWSCTVGTTVSDNITLSHVAAVLDWSSVTFSPQLTSLPSSVTPQNTISVTVTTPCAAPAAVITWRYQQGVSGVPPSSTSSSQGSCPSEQVQTTNTLSLPGNTASLYNRQVSLTVSVEHDSFDPPTYTTSVTSNTIQFPVPVTSVTLTNINSDNEEIGQAASQSLTLTCVTSASFPTSTVTWVTLPSGTTPTVSTETTSGVLVKTTSSVTFTVSRSDQGRSIHCQAENINGQTSPQSNRATLEVWYGPDTNQVRVTKPANTVVAEDRDLTLTCETLASVSPGVTFTWDYSDGSGITGGSTGSVTGSAGTTWSQTRTFRPVRSKTDVRCSVRNTRTAVAATKTLSLGDVKYPPPGRPTLQDFPSVMYAGVQKTIRCSVTGGNPLADITWSCYNISNTGSESSREGTKTSSLTFLVTKHQNSRQCQCGASWMYGGYDETVTQTFTVYYPPDKPTTTNPGTLCEGKSTSLTCSSSPDPGNPPATFYWTKDNAAVHTGTSYTFSPFKADNGADVRCAAGNTYTDRAGSSRPQSDARQLSVYYVGVPTITPAATQTRKEGQSLSLTCSADSNPDNAVISWTFNDSPIPGSSVMKADLNRSDDGEYGCTGRVNTGSVCPGGSLQGRSTVRVIVNYPAEVVLDTQGSATCRPHRVYVGQQNVQLTCMVTAANPAVTSYTWTHNSSVIQSARGAVFSINSVSRTSGGSYTCQGNNSLGGSTSSPVTLEVQYPPSVSVLSSQTVIETQTLTVTCSVDSKPAAAVAWTRTNSSSFTPLSGSTLIISNIQRSQAGTYVCTATNTLSPCGGTTLPRSESREMTVDVQYPATVSMFTANSLSGLVTVNESDPVALRCQVDSNPGPIIRLLNGTEELTRTDNFLASEYRLESADCRQRGNYSCTATNNIGAPVSQRIELMVKCSPRLDETMPQQLEYTSRLGGNVDVSVSVLAYPLPTFTWSRTTSTSQDLTGSSSPVSDISVTARLHLTYLQQQDFGDYRLTVDNGVDRRLFYTVRIVPEATTTPMPPTCGPLTDASLDEDCSNARCVAVNSSCVTTSAGSRRCACVNKNVQISATECSLGPSVLSSTTDYVFSTDLSRTPVTVGSIMFDGLSTFPKNTFSIEGEVYPDEGILGLMRNSSHIDVELVKEISNAKTFVVALRATSGEFTVQQVVTIRITSSSFTPEDVTIMLVEGTRKGSLIADVRTIGSLGGYSNFEMETTDQTARALFNVTTSGQVLCGQDIFLSDFTNNDTIAKEYIFSVKATKGGQRETNATFYILLFKSTFTTTLRENWKGNILSYTITSSKFQVAINDTLPDRLKLSKDLKTISLVEEIDYDAGITSIHFKLDLVTTTKSTTVDVHINIEDQNDERPKFKNAVYIFSLLAGSKGNSVVGVVDVIDGDTVGQTTFSLEGRNKEDFSINDDGVLTSKVDLTRGRFSSAIPLRVKAYDGVSYSEEANITVYLISINAVNLNKTFLGRVSENSTGAFVTNVSVSNYTGYKFANPQAYRFFSLNSTSGLVTTTIGLDRENDDEAYTEFTIQAYPDSGDHCSSVTIGQLITNITDVNDNAPEFSSPSYTGRVKENSVPGTLVVGLVDIAVTDEDTGVNGSVNFALTGPGKTYFAVEKLNHNQFTIKTSGTPIDREVTPYVVLTLTGTDNPSNPNTGTTALNITIMDVNDNAPQFNRGSTVFSVEENVGPMTITILTATDNDEGLNAKVSYSLKDGGFGFFQVEESTGEVSTIKAIDRENRKVFNLIIEAKDQGSPSQQSVLTITVNIRDVNDEKPKFTEKYYKGSYTEKSPCDRNILTATATDQDEGSNANIRFSTTSSNFTVDPISGAIRCVIPLDYEEMQQHLIEIKAENPGFPTMSDTVTVEINVEDVNDNPPRFDKLNYQSEITTWEWATRNPVDVFEVTDDDSGTNGQFILSMSGETDKFYIDGDTVGVLRIKEGASQPVASTTYNFNVTATDKGSPSKSFTVQVSVDVKKIQGTSTVRFSSKDFIFEIEEEKVYNTSFGRAKADHDSNLTVRYTLIHGGDFHIDPSSGALTCSEKQDRETAANHIMVVRARDPTTNASDVAVVKVQILDVNDNRPIFLASPEELVFQVEENSPGKVIGRIIAKDGDADENGRITYSIESQTPRSHFSINPRTGTVNVSGDLDREDYDIYNLIIKATDNGDAPRNATTSAKILVLDINDNPPTFQTKYAVTVKEDSTISASVETVSATDGDLTQHGAIVYSSNTVMLNGTVCPFNVSVETGVVKVSGDLDYETTSTYECIVTAVDMKGCSNCTGRLTGSTTMSVTILDFNDNPPVFQGAPYRANISRDANINTLVTDVITATDRDSVNDGNGVVTYHILSNISYFRINRTSGKIYVATTLDKVNDDEVTLRIKVTDQPEKDTAMEAITSITISILTDEPRPFFNKTYTFLLTENEEPDEDKVVSIRAYVGRSSEVECNCNYDIIDNSSFYIDNMTGDLRQKDPIDREKTGSRFDLRVKATDRRSLLYRTTDVEVNVKDVNDNLPYFNNTQQNFTVHQSAQAGHVIGRVMSVDADELSHPIYKAFTDVEGIKLLGDGTLVVRASLSNYTEVDMIVSVTEDNFTGPFDVSAVITTKASIEVRPDDYNEHAPVFGKDVYEASLEFSSETGTEVKITNFRATDADGHNVTYAIQTRNDRENLKIDGQTGKIYVHIKFDDTVPEVIKLVITATDESPYPKTGSCTVTITLQAYTQTKCVAENAYSQLQQQRELFLGLFIAMAALLAVISIGAVFAIYKWRTLRRRTQYQENINTAHGKTTKSSGQAGYDSLAAGSKDEETAYNKLKDRDFSSGVPNPAYVSTGPRPTCTPPTDPLPDYDDEDANRM